MAPTGLDIKRNIVQLAQLKGLKQSDFISGGIATTTVKTVLQMKSSESSDVDQLMPKTVKEYLEWIRIQLEFVKQRNARI